MSYVSWEYYSSLYNVVSEDDFARLDTRAEHLIDVRTHMRVKKFEASYEAATATDFQNQVHEQIKNTICEVINALVVADKHNDGVTSVSNDGYSESYATSTKTQNDAEITRIIRNGLSGTGLCGAL